jgi:ubiquinone/menaquinone biosynthesis C-methylase UbiE
MSDSNKRVCPVERAGHFDSTIRRWVQNPQKLLGAYLKEGMTVLDVGCGPGYFSIEMARLVGKSGHVIAADLQDGMLQKIRDKIQNTELEARITLHQCGEKSIGWTEEVDFVLAFYMMHELPNQEVFFQEIGALLKPNGQVFIAEPPFHVSKSAFEEMIEKARNAGFSPVAKPKVLLSKAVLLKKG